jgi:hypothetical protein
MAEFNCPRKVISSSGSAIGEGLIAESGWVRTACSVASRSQLLPLSSKNHELRWMMHIPPSRSARAWLALLSLSMKSEIAGYDPNGVTSPAYYTEYDYFRALRVYNTLQNVNVNEACKSSPPLIPSVDLLTARHVKDTYGNLISLICQAQLSCFCVLMTHAAR